jgi:hypothetical protein
MTLSLRQWSDHVWAFYRDDGNPLGPSLEYVTDSRETQALQAIQHDGERYNVDGPASANSPDRTELQP